MEISCLVTGTSHFLDDRESDTHRIYMATPNASITEFAGSGTDGNSDSGNDLLGAEFQSPEGISYDLESNTLFIADTEGKRIRMIKDFPCEIVIPQAVTIIAIIVSTTAFILVTGIVATVLVVVYYRRKRLKRLKTPQPPSARSSILLEVVDKGYPLVVDVPTINGVKIETKIGEGNFSSVSKGSWDGNSVACKALKDQSLMKEVEREAQTMKNLTHPNILTFYGIYKDSQNVSYIVTEFCALGSLDHLLIENPKQFSDEQLLSL